MPEGLEAEIWRRSLVGVIGRTITDIVVDERVADPGFATALTGRRMERVGRHGKIVVIDTSGPSFGMHFGMTGRVVVDGVAPIERLEYASGADRPDWNRLTLFADPTRCPGVPAVRMSDPRRLGRLTLDPDLSGLGPDFLTIDRRTLHTRLAGRRVAVKTALLDQHIVAGLGNLCADEVLWWAGIAPARPVDTLSDTEVGGIATAIRRRMPIMLRRGGSTNGTLSPALRADCPPCPRDGTPLLRSVIGGRTAVWCGGHQH